METITIPKHIVLELIRNKEAEFYSTRNYETYRVKSDSSTELEGNLLTICDEDLADLLFSRVCADDYLTLIVI